MTSSRLRELSRAEEIREACATAAAARCQQYADYQAGRPVTERADADPRMFTAAFLRDEVVGAIRATPLPALRNDAEKYADLRDAVKDAVEQFDSVAGSPRDMDVGILSAHMDRLRAALAALKEVAP